LGWLAGVFVADPVDSFPPAAGDTSSVSTTFSGTAHLVSGAVAFLVLAGAFIALGGWFAERRHKALAAGSRIAGFAGLALGVAVPAAPMGSPFFWLAVLSGWGWLTVASAALYGILFRGSSRAN